MLSDILPTGFECGVLNGQVKPGDTVAIVGAGPDRPRRPDDRAVLLAGRDRDGRPGRQPAARSRARSAPRRPSTAPTDDGRAEGDGADGRRRAWTWPSRPWGSRRPSTSASRSWPRAAASPTSACTASRSQLHLEKLWSHNITLTTRLVDTAATPMLLQDGAVGPAAAQEAGDPPLRARRGDEGVRHVRQRREGARAEGDPPYCLAVGLQASRRVRPSSRAVPTTRQWGRSRRTVVDEAGRGYLWSDELLRPARVRVAE